MQTNFKLIGAKGVLIQLEHLQAATTYDSGVLIPAYENYETEGGRPAAKLSHEVYSTKGTVIALSTKAKEIMATEGYDLTVGDIVVVYPSTKNPQNWFIMPEDLTNPVNDFNGLLLLHPSQIQYVITTTSHEKED